MKDVICPYCCMKFKPNEIHFRLNEPVTDGNQEVNQKENTADKEKLDEYLFHYYINVLGWDKETAREESYRLPYVKFDPMSSDFTFDKVLFVEKEYINEVLYKKEQLLTKRLCPYCHNELIPGAGRDEMLLISVIGDTNVGKTVYLTVLTELLQQDPYFKGALQFAGSAEDKEMYLGNFKKLIRDMEMLPGTERVKIPPMPFYYNYNYIDEYGNEKENSIIVIFYDIAGEDCRSMETMKKRGLNIKYSSGILFLVDPSRFSSIKDKVMDTDGINNRYVIDIFGALNQFLIANTYDTKTHIPTAIVLTKSDLLQDIPYFKGSHSDLLTDEREVHKGYVDQAFVEKESVKIRDFLQYAREFSLLNNTKFFSDVAFFMVSALGKSPQLIDEKYSDFQYIGFHGGIEPYRVTDPFYWILMKNNLISIREHNEVPDSNGEMVAFDIFHKNSREKLYVDTLIEDKIRQITEPPKVKFRVKDVIQFMHRFAPH
ncbi:MAG: hypothetical protein E7256_08150 [Lachnospiraceae bacterium]|nr:hypothetical protein [Lachnospiraceae bacterium]